MKRWISAVVVFLISAVVVFLVVSNLLPLDPAAVQAEEKRSVTPEDIYKLKTPSSITLSPDGQNIAFVLSQANKEANTHHTQIGVISITGVPSLANTGNDGTIAEAYSEPCFSPDGGWIAYQKTEIYDNRSEAHIWVMRVDGSGEKQITNEITNGSWEKNPVWCPDGKKIAYLSYLPEKNESLCIVDGVEERELVRGEAGKVLVNPFGSKSRISWSPDGDSIAYVAARGNYTDILLVDLDGNRRWLTDDSNFELNPTFSPDGKYLAFESGSKMTEYYLRPYVNVIEVESGERFQLTQDDDYSMAPAWSPDGGKIAFAIRKPGPSNSRIWIADANGSNQRALSDDLQFEGGPIVWSPNGSRIMYSSMEAGLNIWDVNVKGTDKRRLTEDDGTFYTPYSYSPDGSRVLYLSHINALRLFNLCLMDSDGGNQSTIAHGKGIEPELIKEEATDFTLRDVDGTEFSLSDFEGIIVLEFMRVGCLACDAQIKNLKNLEERYGENVTIISLGVGEILGLDESVEDLREYRNSMGADWIFAKSTEGVAYSYMTEISCSTVVVIDEEGCVRYSCCSGVQSVVLENVIDRLIQQDLMPIQDMGE